MKYEIYHIKMCKSPIEYIGDLQSKIKYVLNTFV
jgi:hypothetical protein